MTHSKFKDKKGRGDSMLDFKDNYILRQLVESDTILTLTDLQERLEMSQRSIYYSLERINDYLNRIELPTVINKRGVGLLVHDKVIEHFNQNDLTIKELLLNDVVIGESSQEVKRTKSERKRNLKFKNLSYQFE